MPRCASVLVVPGVLLCGALLAAACGSFGASDAPVPTPAPVADAMADAREAPVLSFACGTTVCTAGLHACCQVAAGSFGCFGLASGGCVGAVDAGGPGADGGLDAAPAPPPILCTSYRNCNNTEECCYTVEKGSSCQAICSGGAKSLCTRATDGCGNTGECRDFTDPPQLGIGECVATSPTSGTSGGFHW